jgi:hypothetical protein
MPRGLPHVVKDNLEKCRQSALAAVEVYNRPGPRFRTAQYLILIVIAWTALLHAIFYRRGIKPWYKSKGKSGRGTRYVKLDGDPKHWDLTECLKEYHGGSAPAERKNLEFLIGLRNRIEHRHLPHLDATLYGECQAALMNLEALLVSQFGVKFALGEQLGVALQFSQVIPEEKAKALKVATRASAAPAIAYIESFRGNLPSPVLESMKYSFSVFLVPRVANRQKSADAAVTFVRVDEASPEELERLQKLNVLIREKTIPIANLHLHKPSDVVEQVSAILPHEFNQHHHTCAWKHFTSRPASKAPKRERTDSRYCVYDAAHRDYLYTDAWVDKLIDELSDPTQFTVITGNPLAGNETAPCAGWAATSGRVRSQPPA